MTDFSPFHEDQPRQPDRQPPHTPDLTPAADVPMTAPDPDLEGGAAVDYTVPPSGDESPRMTAPDWGKSDPMGAEDYDYLTGDETPETTREYIPLEQDPGLRRAQITQTVGWLAERLAEQQVPPDAGGVIDPTLEASRALTVVDPTGFRDEFTGGWLVAIASARIPETDDQVQSEEPQPDVQWSGAVALSPAAHLAVMESLHDVAPGSDVFATITELSERTLAIRDADVTRQPDLAANSPLHRYLTSTAVAGMLNRFIERHAAVLDAEEIEARFPRTT